MLHNAFDLTLPEKAVEAIKMIQDHGRPLSPQGGLAAKHPVRHLPGRGDLLHHILVGAAALKEILLVEWENEVKAHRLRTVFAALKYQNGEGCPLITHKFKC